MVFYILSGHGLNVNSMQTLLINEYKNGWYRFYPFEHDIRNFANKFPQVFLLCCFACCREIYVPSVHTGGFKWFVEAEAQLLKD